MPLSPPKLRFHATLFLPAEVPKAAWTFVALPRDASAKLPARGPVSVAWSDITPLARRDWVQWVTSAKLADTRARRLQGACDMLAKGKRRPCCFDRSGMYSGGIKGPSPKPGR